MPIVHVACLCAAWCGLCESYRAVWREVAAETALQGQTLHWHWIDIEDESELLGDLDIETFPTLVIADSAGVRFAGPITPQPDTLRRLLRATVLEAAANTTSPPPNRETLAFAQRLLRRPHKPP